MKTHINQILTVVSFFSLSITTILAISWGMNGLIVNEPSAIIQSIEKNNGTTKDIQEKTDHKYIETKKSQMTNNTLKSKG